MAIQQSLREAADAQGDKMLLGWQQGRRTPLGTHLTPARGFLSGSFGSTSGELVRPRQQGS